MTADGLRTTGTIDSVNICADGIHISGSVSISEGSITIPAPESVLVPDVSLIIKIALKDDAVSSNPSFMEAITSLSVNASGAVHQYDNGILQSSSVVVNTDNTGTGYYRDGILTLHCKGAFPISTGKLLPGVSIAFSTVIGPVRKTLRKTTPSRVRATFSAFSVCRASDALGNYTAYVPGTSLDTYAGKNLSLTAEQLDDLGGLSGKLYLNSLQINVQDAGSLVDSFTIPQNLSVDGTTLVNVGSYEQQPSYGAAYDNLTFAGHLFPRDLITVIKGFTTPPSVLKYLGEIDPTDGAATVTSPACGSFVIATAGDLAAGNVLEGTEIAAGTTFAAGDYAVYDGTNWYHVPVAGYPTLNAAPSADTKSVYHLNYDFETADDLSGTYGVLASGTASLGDRFLIYKSGTTVSTEVLTDRTNRLDDRSCVLPTPVIKGAVNDVLFVGTTETKLSPMVSSLTVDAGIMFGNMRTLDNEIHFGDLVVKNQGIVCPSAALKCGCFASYGTDFEVSRLPINECMVDISGHSAVTCAIDANAKSVVVRDSTVGEFTNAATATCLEDDYQFATTHAQSYFGNTNLSYVNFPDTLKIADFSHYASDVTYGDLSVVTKNDESFYMSHVRTKKFWFDGECAAVFQISSPNTAPNHNYFAEVVVGTDCTVMLNILTGKTVVEVWNDQRSGSVSDVFVTMFEAALDVMNMNIEDTYPISINDPNNMSLKANHSLNIGRIDLAIENAGGFDLKYGTVKNMQVSGSVLNALTLTNSTISSLKFMDSVTLATFPINAEDSSLTVTFNDKAELAAGVTSPVAELQDIRGSTISVIGRKATTSTTADVTKIDHITKMFVAESSDINYEAATLNPPALMSIVFSNLTIAHARPVTAPTGNTKLTLEHDTADAAYVNLNGTRLSNTSNRDILVDAVKSGFSTFTFKLRQSRLAGFPITNVSVGTKTYVNPTYSDLHKLIV